MKMTKNHRAATLAMAGNEYTRVSIRKMTSLPRLSTRKMRISFTNRMIRTKLGLKGNLKFLDAFSRTSTTSEIHTTNASSLFQRSLQYCR